MPGGAEKGEVKYTSVFMVMVKRNGAGLILTRTVSRSVTGVSRMVAVAPSTNTATREAAKQTLVTSVNGLQSFNLPIKASETNLVLLAPLKVSDTGSTVVTSMTSL